MAIDAEGTELVLFKYIYLEVSHAETQIVFSKQIQEPHTSNKQIDSTNKAANVCFADNLFILLLVKNLDWIKAVYLKIISKQVK